MKINISNSIAALFALSLASSASAATLASYYTGDNSYVPYDYADHLKTPTSLVAVAGSGLTQAGEQLRGWGTSIDLQKYAGFKISAEPGYELLVDVFYFRGSGFTGPSGSSSFQLGYRTDLNNDGFFSAAGEEWTLGKLYTPADSDYINTASPKQWDVDIKTTGTVEFGFFSSAATSDGLSALRTVDVIGSVNAVPEPSASLLTALGGLALLRRRRK